MTTIVVPARAKVVASQTASTDRAAIYYGQTYHYRGAVDPSTGYIPAAGSSFNLAMWDPAAEGQPVARAQTGPFHPVGSGAASVRWVFNVAYTWDLTAVQAAHGPIDPFGSAWVDWTVSTNVPYPGSGSPPQALQVTYGARLAEPELGARCTTSHSLGFYAPVSVAWRDPPGTSGTPLGWVDSDVPSPSTYFPGWGTLMDFGNGVAGQVPRIPKIPIEPLGFNSSDTAVTPIFSTVDVTPAGFTGTRTTLVDPLGFADSGRWLMLWIGFDVDYQREYAFTTLARDRAVAELGLTASLHLPLARRAAPPLWQRQRIGAVDSPEGFTSGLLTPQSSPWQGATL